MSLRSQLVAWATVLVLFTFPALAQVSNSASGEAESLVVVLQPAESSDPGTVVGFVGADQEIGFILEAIEKSPTPVTIYHSGDNDPIVVALKEKGLIHRVNLVATEALADERETHPTEAPTTVHVNFKRERAFASGVGVVLLTTGLFTGPFFFTASTEVAVKMLGVATMINSLQAIFTPQWQGLLNSTGHAIKSLELKARKLFGWINPVNTHSFRVGQLVGAYGFNLLTTTTFLHISGADASAPTIMGYAALGLAAMTWDPVLIKLQAEGRMRSVTVQRVIQAKLLLGSLLGALVLQDVVPAQIALGTIGTTGLLALFGGEKIRNWMANRSLKAQQEFGDKNVITRLLQRVRNFVFRRKTTCGDLLSPDSSSSDS